MLKSVGPIFPTGRRGAIAAGGAGKIMVRVFLRSNGVPATADTQSTRRDAYFEQPPRDYSAGHVDLNEYAVLPDV